MKIQTPRKARESGQAVVLVVLAVSIFMMAALGLAIDGSHMWAQRQLMQAAADAGAQAGIMSIYRGTYSSGANQFSLGGTAGATYSDTCDKSGSDARTPCFYAQTLNGFNTASDTVTYTANPAGLGIPGLSPDYAATANLFQVTVTRNVPATLMALLGWSTMPVTATGVAAIVQVDSPVPIVVTHPTLSGSFNLGGSGSTNKIKICGGPGQSIQVNSTSASAMTWTGNPVVDLSRAGPKDPGNCTTGTGASFGVTGGPNGGGTIVSLGSTGLFVAGDPPISDPLSGVSAPSDPSTSSPAGPTNPPTVALAAGQKGCPAASGGCVLYFPGKYTSDIKVKNATAVFAPGIYYMYGANFTADANGNMYYATGLTDSTATTMPDTGLNCCGTGTGWGAAGNSPAYSGIVVYMTGPVSGGGTATTGAISVSSNSVVNLVGAPNSSSYLGILFFADRNAASITHSLDGGGGLTLTGTIYTNSSRNSATVYQTLHFQGNAGSSTVLTGEIITSTLDLQGTPGIVMNLNSQASYKINQVALVQ